MEAQQPRANTTNYLLNLQAFLLLRSFKLASNFEIQFQLISHSRKPSILVLKLENQQAERSQVKIMYLIESVNDQESSLQRGCNTFLKYLLRTQEDNNTENHFIVAIENNKIKGIVPKQQDTIDSVTEQLYANKVHCRYKIQEIEEDKKENIINTWNANNSRIYHRLAKELIDHYRQPTEPNKMFEKRTSSILKENYAALFSDGAVLEIVMNTSEKNERAKFSEAFLTNDTNQSRTELEDIRNFRTIFGKVWNQKFGNDNWRQVLKGERFPMSPKLYKEVEPRSNNTVFPTDTLMNVTNFQTLTDKLEFTTFNIETEVLINEVQEYFKTKEPKITKPESKLIVECLLNWLKTKKDTFIGIQESEYALRACLEAATTPEEGLEENQEILDDLFANINRKVSADALSRLQIKQNEFSLISAKLSIRTFTDHWAEQLKEFLGESMGLAKNKKHYNDQFLKKLKGFIQNPADKIDFRVKFEELRTQICSKYETDFPSLKDEEQFKQDVKKNY